MSDTLDLAMALVHRRSVTPDDAGCQELMIGRLESLGFKVERLRFGEVDNFWARRGEVEPVFCFAGHTDVVPPGPESAWTSDPFTPTLREGRLFGRGAADMKGSLAAMVTATEAFVAAHPDHLGSIAFLVTSDEEGAAVHGTVKVIETLEARGEKIRWCLVGEPSSDQQLGDVVKNGRRGSLGGRLIVHGKQGHVAYPHLARNPVHLAAPALAELAATVWDQGNAHFPPSTFQISNVHAGSGATNVVPGSLEVLFNFRYSTASDEATLVNRVQALLDAHGLDYDIEWTFSGKPFLTDEGELVEAARRAIRAELGYETRLSTAGGTSDGRFIAPTGAQVLELGPVNATIHQVDECVEATELDQLSRVYASVLRQLLNR